MFTRLEQSPLHIDNSNAEFSSNISEKINILTPFCKLLEFLCKFLIYCSIYKKKERFFLSHIPLHLLNLRDT